MAASNKLGEGMGERRMKQVLTTYPNLLKDYKKWSKEEFIDKIKKIDGWEEKTSSLLVSNFEEFINFYEKIKSFVKIEKQKEVKESVLTGKTIVISGFRDANLQEMLEGMGVKISSSVSKNTNYLIIKDKETLEEATGKIQKAKELGIQILTKEELLKIIK
jgi:DNA ligase (NAD+)